MVGCRAELVRRGSRLEASRRKWCQVVGSHRRVSLITTWQPQMACFHLSYNLCHTPILLFILIFIFLLLLKSCLAFFTSESGSKRLFKLNNTTAKQLLPRFRLVVTAAEDVRGGGEVVRCQAGCWKTKAGLGAG